ncbi:MAG: tetratricopeptide repeat protein [Azoarcus sp.]|jgi:tetratricopeptide (TPR) repeat protein|nr:tetratricopeptide repeat protein [Azoarcus sp.]
MKTMFRLFDSRGTRAFSRNTAVKIVAAAALSLIAGLAPVHAQKRSQHAGHQEQASARAAARIQAARTLFDRGVAAANKDNEKAALAAYEQIAQQYNKNDPPAIRVLFAKALLNKGAILGEQGNIKEAIATYQKLDQRLGQDKDPAVREVVASALVSKAEAFYKQGNHKTAIATYSQLGKRFANDNSAFIKHLIAITKWRTAEILADSTALSSTR